MRVYPRVRLAALDAVLGPLWREYCPIENNGVQVGIGRHPAYVDAMHQGAAAGNPFALGSLYSTARTAPEIREAFATQRRSAGGKRRAEKAREQAAEHWSFGDVFPTAYTELVERFGRVTAGRLAQKAWTVAKRLGYADAERAELTEYRARQYIKRQQAL